MSGKVQVYLKHLNAIFFELSYLLVGLNWKTKLVLKFTGMRDSFKYDRPVNMEKLRKGTDSAAKLGSFLFDSKINIKKVENTLANNIPIRIYSHNNQQDLPVMIYYHGGGFAILGLDSHDNVCRRLCKMNKCIVVSVDYRLAPEHSFPAAHNDAFTALKWTLDNISKYNGNPKELILVGDSAGGNLAACMAHRCKKDNIPVTAQILVYPWIDGKMNNPSIERNGAGYMLTKEALFWYQNMYTPNENDRLKPEVSPCYEVDFKGLAPAFIITAEYDPLLDDGKNYYEQLSNAGNKAEYKEYPGMIHGFFNLPKISPVAMQTYKDIKVFLNSI